MPRSSEVLEAVGVAAAGQWGLITSAQARAEGMTTQQLARLANAGVLERLRHGVYRVAGAPGDPHEDLRAAWLAFAPSKTLSERLDDPAGVEVVSHRSAALLHELGDLDADYLEFTTPVRRQSRDHQVRIHRGQLRPDEWTRVRGLPVTTVVRTIRDLASAEIDGGHLAGVVRDAVTTEHVDVAALAAALSPYAHHYGAPLGQGAVLLQQLLEQAGIPESTQVAGRLVDWSEPSGPARKVVESAATLSANTTLSANATRSAAALSQIDMSALEALQQSLRDVYTARTLMTEAAATKALNEIISSLPQLDPGARDALHVAQTYIATLRGAAAYLTGLESAIAPAAIPEQRADRTPPNAGSSSAGDSRAESDTARPSA